MNALARAACGPDRDLLSAEIVRLDSTGCYDRVAARYLEGGCLAFAYALWIAHGCRKDASIAILSNDFGEGWGDIDHEATHAYLTLPEGDMDVRGFRDVSHMAGEMNIDYWSIAAELHPDEAISTYAGGFSTDVEMGDYPIGLEQDDIVDALVHIANHPKRYGLGE